jgi:hypothetical protein
MFRGTIMKVDFSCIIIVFDEEILCLDVFGAFGAGETAILFQG